MSYTILVKEEVFHKVIKDKKEIDLEIYTILKVKNAFSDKMIDLKVENISLAKRVYTYLKEYTNLKTMVKYTTSKRLGEHKVYHVMAVLTKEYKDYFDKYAKIKQENLLKNNRALAGFVRGIFLSTGYIKPPDKEYSMDFFIESEEISYMLYNVLKELGKRVSVTRKKNKFLVYLRNSEDIMDILVMIGAMKAFFEYEEVTLVKDIKNKTIRSMNWELANETKTVSTGQRQVNIIKYLEKRIGLDTLTDVLKQAAYTRLENPEYSLTELADAVGLTKSGVRNRFRRIENIYKNLKEKDEI